MVSVRRQKLNRHEMEAFIQQVSDQVVNLNDSLVEFGEKIDKEYPELGIRTMVQNETWDLLVARVHQLLDAVDPDAADVLNENAS